MGGSSGAVLAAGAQYLEKHSEIKRPVCLCPDTGENYTSSIFSDEWLRQQQLNVTSLPGTRIEIVNQAIRDNNAKNK